MYIVWGDQYDAVTERSDLLRIRHCDFDKIQVLYFVAVRSIIAREIGYMITNDLCNFGNHYPFSCLETALLAVLLYHDHPQAPNSGSPADIPGQKSSVLRPFQLTDSWITRTPYRKLFQNHTNARHSIYHYSSVFISKQLFTKITANHTG